MAVGTSAALLTGLLAVTAPAGSADTTETEGTVKVVASGDVKQKPKLTCSFDVLLSGFAADQTGDFAFYAQPPSARHQLLTTDPGKALSGNPDPARYSYTATDLGLPGTARAHRKHGYHVKLVVTLPDTTKKSKVFWLKGCPA